MTKQDIIFEDFSTKYDEDVQSVTEALDVLNEVHFSKEDLQDPKAVKRKIEEPAEKFKNTAFAIDFIISALTVLVSVIAGIATGNLVMIPMGIGISVVLSDSLFNIICKATPMFIKNNKKKYDKQFAKLKANCEKTIRENKNPEAVKEATIILNNLKKVENTVSAKVKEAKKEKYENTYKYIKTDYNNAIDFLNGKYISDDFIFEGGNRPGFGLGTFSILTSKNIGLSPEKYFDILGKHKDKMKTAEKNNLFKYSGGLLDDKAANAAKEAERLESCGITKDTLIYWIYIDQYNDNDVDCFYAPALKKVFVYEYSIDELNGYTPSNFAKKFLKESCAKYMSKENMNILKDVDKDLGYYKFSECPKNVQQKPFPKF